MKHPHTYRMCTNKKISTYIDNNIIYYVQFEYKKYAYKNAI